LTSDRFEGSRNLFFQHRDTNLSSIDGTSFAIITTLPDAIVPLAYRAPNR
jgi:hypothetical protein